MTETAEVRLKRLRLRSMRRGIKEMDLLLGAFSAPGAGLARLSRGQLDAYESLLEESDHDLLAWITGSAAVPDRHAELIGLLAAEARAAAAPERFLGL